MKDLSKNQSPDQIIETILTALDEKVISTQVDKPVDQVRKTFQYTERDISDVKKIHTILASFYQAVHEKIYHYNTNASDCFTEVLVLLEGQYQGNLSNGYIAAMMDAQQGDYGMDIVLYRLADIIKSTEREKYISGVFSANIDPDNWQLRCSMVEVLQKQYQTILPPGILDCKPEQFVDEIPVLINIIINSCGTIEQILNSCRKNSIL